MRIEIDKQIVRFIPESKQEEEELNKLWQYVVSCEGESFRLVPIGVYVPGSTKEAMFQVEGVKVETQPSAPKKKIRYVCMECNRMEEYPPGEAPVCCGQPMHPMD
ncbi:MAG: hypothetical protein GXO20_07915 [Thermodesulfobacteria bacterium]|nr:hypothetical protein [Thermodesulfobacteriota bacterium]